jgi:putative oxidoreductase
LNKPFELSSTFFIVGRVLIGIYFLLPGISKVFLFSDNLNIVIINEVPFPTFSLSIIAITQIVCGIWIIFGKNLKASSLSLVITTLLINFFIHDFWNLNGSPEQAHELQNFVKNLGILAGLLILSKER